MKRIIYIIIFTLVFLYFAISCWYSKEGEGGEAAAERYVKVSCGGYRAHIPLLQMQGQGTAYGTQPPPGGLSCQPFGASCQGPSCQGPGEGGYGGGEDQEGEGGCEGCEGPSCEIEEVDEDMDNDGIPDKEKPDFVIRTPKRPPKPDKAPRD